MIFVSIIYLMHLWIFVQLRTDNVSANDGFQYDNLLNATLALNKHFNIKHWAVHFQNGNSLDQLITHLKGHVHQYVIFNDVLSTTTFHWQRERMLHLFIADNFETLKEMLQAQTDTSKFDSREENVLCGQSIWVIHVIGYRKHRILMNALKKSSIAFDSLVFEFFVSDKELQGENGRITIKELYKIDIQSETVYEIRYGEWRANEGITVLESSLFKRRSNFHGFEFKILSSKWFTSQTLVKDGCSNSSCFQGKYPEVLFLLQSKLNFTFKIIDEKPSGYDLKNGSWTGKIGMLIDNKADFAISTFGMRKDRAKVVDYLIVDNVVGLGRFYVKIPRDTYHWTVFFEPLHKEAWIGIAAFGLVVSVLVSAIIMYRNQLDDGHWTFTTCIVLTLRSLILLGSDETLNTDRKRALGVTVMMGGMVLYWLWESCLTSYFLLPKPNVGFQSVEEFYTNTNKKLIVRRGFQRQFFSKSNDTVLQSIYRERIQPYENDTIYKNGTCKVMEKISEDGSYAFFTISSTVYSMCDAYQKCKVVTAPFTTGRFAGGAGWLFPKRSPFFSIFNHYVRVLKETGLKDRIVNTPEYDPKYLLPDQECETFDGHPVSMSIVFSLFAMLSGAAGLSLVLMSFEKFVPSHWYATALDGLMQYGKRMMDKIQRTKIQSSVTDSWKESL